jgi:uncharacterized RDD family membrane protein YckC
MSISDTIRFETPENVQVRYDVAGLGTRFVAWFVDQIVVWVVTILLLISLMIVGLSFDSIFWELDRGEDDNANRAILYLAGIMTLVWGFGSFFYFAACELLLHGQTIGKRTTNIRVVKADGFQLDAVSIVVRNLFRVLDQLPPMWIIPFVSKRNQRAGDMVAGTLVVSDVPAELSPVRAVLAQRTAADLQFRFDQSRLKRLNGADFAAIERVLDRWPDLNAEQQQELLAAYTTSITKKLGVEPPALDQRLRFLEDLFSAELRRRERSLV